MTWNEATTKESKAGAECLVSLHKSPLVWANNNTHPDFVNSVFPLTVENFQVSLKSLDRTLKFTMQAFCFKKSILSGIAILFVFY